MFNPGILNASPTIGVVSIYLLLASILGPFMLCRPPPVLGSEDDCGLIQATTSTQRSEDVWPMGKSQGKEHSTDGATIVKICCSPSRSNASPLYSGADEN